MNIIFNKKAKYNYEYNTKRNEKVFKIRRRSGIINDLVFCFIFISYQDIIARI
jgi:hypothetical protein